MLASSAMLAIVGSYRGCRWAPMLWASLATLQAPPFVLLLAFVWARRVLAGPLPRSAGDATLAAAPALASPLFFYLYFGTPSLIARESAHLSNLSASRTLDLLLDLNLGLVAYMPVTVALFALAAAAALWRAPRAPWDAVLLAATALMAVTTTANGNWNHGTVGPSRYAVWLLPMVCFLVVRLADQAPAGRGPLLTTALALAIAVQATVVVGKGATLAEPDYHRHSDLARLVLRYRPGWYNPDHQVFEARATRGDASGPWIYEDAGRCRKALVRARPRHLRELRHVCGSIPPADLPWLEGGGGPGEWRYVNY
jgi:hypothetical protein